MDVLKDVKEFHTKFGLHVPEKVGFPSESLVKFRVSLVDEEMQELCQALHFDRDMIETADAIADLIYVLVGMAITFGIPLEKVWDEVHRTNMAKVGGRTRDDGKIMKPEGWQPPDIKKILDEVTP